MGYRHKARSLLSSSAGAVRSLWARSGLRLGSSPELDCAACGVRSPKSRPAVLDTTLISHWELSPSWAAAFGRREGASCRSCGNSARTRHLASTIVTACNALLGTTSEHLAALVKTPAFRGLSVAEVNGCGQLHSILRDHPGLRYSEYGSASADVPSEDLCKMTYADQCLDLVLTSDTIEHVPDLSRALQELHRVLRPGGMHIFTAPVVWDGRLTRRRCSYGADGAVLHQLSPSYHGPSSHPTRHLVVYEFGCDLPTLVQRDGFDLRVHVEPTNSSICSFVATRR